ncbi:hypothetical protein [Methanoculleus taiwanensis]|uniref:hypothetical protein n=1 Tax=Methanoculleus taiwanensis TaxID=1550565 RepID=UPI000FFF6313|nr:hypothetical protein [Methanoculleus taiwanensis]
MESVNENTIHPVLGKVISSRIEGELLDKYLRAKKALGIRNDSEALRYFLTQYFEAFPVV